MGNIIAAVSEDYRRLHHFFLIVFVLFFLLKGLWLWGRLGRIIKELKKYSGGAVPKEYRKIFGRDSTLTLLWSEYYATLHQEKELVDGERRVAAWRATVPAELYFNAQHVFENRIYTEFFKHLPGIFTGIGIIGTFFGLIMGLRGFTPSVDPAETVKMIGPLVHAVYEAFMVSAGAVRSGALIDQGWSCSSWCRPDTLPSPAQRWPSGQPRRT